MGVKLPKLKGKAKKKVTDKDIAERRKILSVWLVRALRGGIAAWRGAPMMIDSVRLRSWLPSSS